MSTHEPRQVVEEVRNHLAAHDRRLAFLFGAGTSSAINVAPAPAPGEKPKHEPLIPGIEALTEVCGAAVGMLGADHAAAWNALVKQCEQDGPRANVEKVLSNVRMKIDAIGDGETLVGLGRDQLIAIENTICAAIAKKVNPSEDRIPKRTPHGDFAVWVKKVNRTAPSKSSRPTTMFCSKGHSKRPVSLSLMALSEHTSHFSIPNALMMTTCCRRQSGFVCGSCMARSVGVSKERSGDERKRIVRGQPSESGEMILPSHRKYDQSRKQPYMAYMDRLSRTLNSEHALIVAIGYGFGDEHINSILYGSLDNRNTANVIALQFEELKEGEEIVQAAIRRSNLTVIGPNGGVISGTWGSWKLTQPVDKKTCSFMDTAFDSNALPEEGGSPAAVTDDLTGRMRLGDFVQFSRFLNDMGPDV